MIKLSLENTTKKYVIKGRPVTAIEDVSLTVEAGTFTALVGSSGSGKSTILHLISGIEQPSSGKIIIDDQDIAQLTSQQLSEFRQKKIGIIFQQFYLDPTLTLNKISNFRLCSRNCRSSSVIRGLLSWLRSWD